MFSRFSWLLELNFFEYQRKIHWNNYDDWFINGWDIKLFNLIFLSQTFLIELHLYGSPGVPWGWIKILYLQNLQINVVLAWNACEDCYCWPPVLDIGSLPFSSPPYTRVPRDLVSVNSLYEYVFVCVYVGTLAERIQEMYCIVLHI